MPVEVAEGEKIIGELFRLTNKTTDVTANTDAYCENYNIQYAFAPIWYYQVPVGQELVFLPEHKFYAYIEDDGVPAEWLDTQKVRVELWSSDERKMEVLLLCRYVQVKESQERDLMIHLDVDRPMRAKAGDWIKIAGRCADTVYTIDVSVSYFTLECLRVRPSMFG